VQNDVLNPANEFLSDSDVVGRIAARSVAARSAGYAHEVRRLLDAGLAVMRRLGTGASPRVADVVAEAGLSNDAFYRHFAGKDEFVTAIIDAGTERLERELAEQMRTSSEPAAQVRLWVESMMNRAVDGDVAETVRVVVWNAYRVGDDTRRRGAGRERLARLLVAPIDALGSDDPERDALLACYACMLRMEEFLWRREVPSSDDIEQVVAFCLRGVGAKS
jgi:AcrR family transcriptional regulator